MSDWTGKKARLVEKRARHIENLKATHEAIATIDTRIAECNERIAAETIGGAPSLEEGTEV